MINRSRLNLRLRLSPVSKLIAIIAVIACLPAYITGCSFQKYVPKPINTATNAAKFERQDPASEQFQQYLINHGYSSEHLPLQQWGLDELTYCALFFHPSLETARTQWRAAEATEMVAAEKPLPTANGRLAHSDDADPTKKPFAFGLSIDVPIETANKRDLRIENARHLSQIAKLEIAHTAWKLRNNIAQSLTEYSLNQQQIRLLTEENIRRQEIVSIYQKRVNLGAASKVELSNANLQLQSNTSELNSKQQNKLVLLSKLASNLGLPLSKVESMQLVVDENRQSANIPASEIQATALLNRLDIRIALERYAAAETKLKLEIAKQYPDLIISPGYAFEFGDNVWSLGLSGLLTLLNKNKVHIAEATQLREVEAAQFEALQAKVISEAYVANAEVIQARLTLANQQKINEQQQSNTQRMLHKFAAGEIDRLELAFAKLESIATEKNIALANFQLQTSLDQLEDTLQKPLVGAGVKNEP